MCLTALRNESALRSTLPTLARMTGADVVDLPWSDLGEGPKAGFAPGGPTPALAEIGAAWTDLEPRFLAALVSADEAALTTPSPMPIPGVENPTAREFAALNVVHEGYHVGQLGLIAKACTGEGILDKVLHATG